MVAKHLLLLILIFPYFPSMLRILASYEAKTTKIKSKYLLVALLNSKKRKKEITGQNVQKLQIFAVFAS